jgi:hypothetical protein
MSRGLKGVGMMGQAMPKLTERLAENTKNAISNMPDELKSMAMGLLRLDNINEIYGKELPSLQKLIDALERLNGMQEKRIKEINDLTICFRICFRRFCLTRRIHGLIFQMIMGYFQISSKIKSFFR